YARRFFRLPYLHARMTTSRKGNSVHYRSLRREGEPAALCIDAEVGEELPPPKPGTLEFFLVERYALFASRGEGYATGRVYHTPYRIRSAKVMECEENLTSGILSACSAKSEWDH